MKGIYATFKMGSLGRDITPVDKRDRSSVSVVAKTQNCYFRPKDLCYIVFPAGIARCARRDAPRLLEPAPDRGHRAANADAINGALLPNTQRHSTAARKD